MTKKICDRCMAEINPLALRTMVTTYLPGEGYRAWDDPESEKELCMSCAKQFAMWLKGEVE